MAILLPEKNLDTNLLYMGNSQPSSVYYGDTEIYKIYFGSTLLYMKSQHQHLLEQGPTNGLMSHLIQYQT